jgi:hypothetical protein
MLILLLYLMMFVTGVSCASAASSSDGQTQEYNLQRLILPFAGDRYLGADPNVWYTESDPNGVFSHLWTERLVFKIAGSEVERLGRFAHSTGFIANNRNQFDLLFCTRFPKLVRSMTFLADHGMLAFNEGFYSIAAAVLRAHYLHARDKAVALRRIESTPMLPANFNDHDAHIDGLDTLPDAPMIGYFYNQFKAHPPKAWDALLNGHGLLRPEVVDIETMPEALRPLTEMVYERVGPYAHLLNKGITDWQQAKKELKQDIQIIQESACSRWEKVAALRALFYATDGKTYHTKAPLAQTHRPTEVVYWNVTCQHNNIDINPYCPINGTLPALFANKVRTALQSIVHGEKKLDEEQQEVIEIIPSLTFDEIPPTEVLRLLNHVVIGRPLQEKETAVATIEAYLLKLVYDCLVQKILDSIESSENNVYMVDIRRILDGALQSGCAELHPHYCVTQRLLEALPLEHLHGLHSGCENLLALAPAIDLHGDTAQSYYALRAGQEQILQNFDLYLYLHAYGDAPQVRTARWIHAWPSLWHFMHLTQERQKEFLLRMWYEHIKVPLEVDAFVAKYGCNERCRQTCYQFMNTYRYLLGNNDRHDHYLEHVRMLRDGTKQENWLPEMCEEIAPLRRAILEKMYPRYKHAMQKQFARRAEECRLDMNMEQKLLVRYIKTLDRNGCRDIINHLQHPEAQAVDETVRADFEASLPVEIRTYLLLPLERQQQLLCALRWRYYTLSLLAMVSSIIRACVGR